MNLKFALVVGSCIWTNELKKRVICSVCNAYLIVRFSRRIPPASSAKTSFNVENRRTLWLVDMHITRHVYSPTLSWVRSASVHYVEKRTLPERNSLNIAKTNTITMSNEKISHLVFDKIFGPANEVLVTMDQMSELASELYSKLDILKDSWTKRNLRNH